MEKRRHLFLNVSKREEGTRLDNFVAEHLDLSRAFAQKLISQGLVKVNGGKPSKAHHVKVGEAIEVYIPPAEKLELIPEKIPLNILYEDNDVIVLSKEAGMVVHPSAGHQTGTLVHALLAHAKGLSQIGGTERPGIIHRLDMNTSGLMMVARNDFSHKKLSSDLKARKVKRIYQALVHGRLKDDEGMIDAPVGRHIIARKKMAVSEISGRHAVTRYRVLERFDDLTLLEVRPETGRTHQIRVHLAYIKHPVVGDSQYGSNRKKDRELGIKRQFLHAVGLTFDHPRLKKEMTFTDKLAPDLASILKKLRKV